MIGLLLFLAVALFMISCGARGWRRTPSPLLDRGDCPHCGQWTKRGTGCIDCGTWVGR